MLTSSWIKAKPAAGDTFSWDICWKQQMVDLLIQMCQLRLWVQLVTTVPGVISLEIQWWEIAKEKNRSRGILFLNKKMKAKRKSLPRLWLILIILCSTCSLSTPCGSTLLLIADAWFLQSMGAPGDEQIPTLPWGICVPDSLHCVQFILVDMTWCQGCVYEHAQRHFRGVTHDGNHHFRVCVQQLTAGTVTEQSQEWAVGLELTSANKSLFHAAATVHVWFTLWWTSERDLWTYKAVTQAMTSTTGTAQEGHNSALNSEPVVFQPQMWD